MRIYDIDFYTSIYGNNYRMKIQVFKGPLNGRDINVKKFEDIRQHTLICVNYLWQNKYVSEFTNHLRKIKFYLIPSFIGNGTILCIHSCEMLWPCLKDCRKEQITMMFGRRSFWLCDISYIKTKMRSTGKNSKLTVISLASYL